MSQHTHTQQPCRSTSTTEGQTSSVVALKTYFQGSFTLVVMDKSLSEQGVTHIESD